uniref:ubiquitinyl hydrolase 1 n=1 Tax=Kryptolebias marmoratus TaxID=37003 RepID=A0A3Q3AX20_KRYMA
MFVYRPEQLQKQRRPAVEQVVKHLLGPFCSQNLVVQLDGSVCRVQTDLFGPGLHIHLDPVLTGEATGPSSSSSSSVPLNQDHPTSEDSELSAHLQGWTGPALVLLSDLKGPGSDPFLPGLWATLSGSRTRSSWNRPGVCGLDNLGNSCYLNAVLQCLSSTVPLVEHLLNPDTRRELTKCKCRVAEVFLRLLEKMWLGSSSICAAAEARSVLSSVLPQFNNYCQQDAQELLLHLLDLLHQDLREVARRQMNSNMKHQARKEQNRTWSIESTMVSLLFEGQLRYTTLCLRCERQAQNLQSFTVLSLPIPTDTTRCSIQDCLSLFFEETVLTGAEQMFCSECGLRRETAVFTCLDKPPEILMLHLKRWVEPPLCEEHLYLRGSEKNHVGHLNMGHYTAVCYNGPARTWFCFDDAEVREVQDSLVPSPNAYLLLYSRRPFQKPKILGL